MYKTYLVLSMFLWGFVSLAGADLKLTIDETSGLTESFDGLILISDGIMEISAVFAASTYGFDLSVIANEAVTLDTSGVIFPNNPWWPIGGTPIVGVPTEQYARLTGGAFMALPEDSAAFTGLVINGFGTVTFDEIVDNGSHVVSNLTVVPLPVPTSLAFLGLGALALRQKNK